MAKSVDVLAFLVFSVSFALAFNFWGAITDVFQHYFGLVSEADIVIGILSARDHFEQRQTLRDTWVGNIQNDSNPIHRIIVKFLVGQEACSIPLDYREDPYSCKELNIGSHQSVPSKLRAMQVTECTGFTNQDQRFTGGTTGFDFKINHGIVIDKLGVYNMGDIVRPVKVTLFDTWRKEPIAISHFSSEQPGVLQDGFRYRPVEPYILPKDFEGTIVVEGLGHHSMQNENCMCTEEDGIGLITIRQLIRSGDVTGGFPELTHRLVSSSLYPVGGNFIYHLHDPESLSLWHSNKEQQQREHILKTEEETKRLEEELSVHNDLLLLDVTDTYRNLPKKVLLFYQWVDRTFSFNYVIKTDDDCFLNIHNILTGIKAKKLHRAKKTWWGNFRTSWAVQHNGKWSDLEYPCSGYPSFACGAGSLLTADVVRWIAMNHVYLHSYQGEDVSLGIWLSAILPYYDHDTKWVCDDTCDTGMYVSAEHKPNELRTMWGNLVECGDPCGCPGPIT
ncbi:UDP-GalNAc:beta-1,3-N-acetylgalactosaminyltransferase 2-like [Amphiura filiformis]|uniref:UDP-GalNAc:beta-1, 3-N-acetylgalactosaminyltransferase 2-like n=1 Tax=Amphiura filiformis TaxID=82378 RepID=UPI003B21A30E